MIQPWKERNLAIWDNLDGSWEHYAKYQTEKHKYYMYLPGNLKNKKTQNTPQIHRNKEETGQKVPT